MIPDSNTNIVYVSRKLREWYPEFFHRFTALMDEIGVVWHELKFTRDIWARDYMPLQLSETEFLKYRYYPDYLDNNEDRRYITNCRQACKYLDINYTETDIVLDGGNVVLCGDYIVMTDKVFTENGKQKYDKDFAKKLESLLQHKIIFIPWHQISKEEPYGHADGFIHWCGENRVLMSNHYDTDPEEAMQIKHRLEAQGFEVIEMKFNVARPRKSLNWAYVNYLQVGNKIIMPWFGITEDRQAEKFIQTANPDCIVFRLKMNEIAVLGGALHCITWNIKL